MNKTESKSSLYNYIKLEDDLDLKLLDLLQRKKIIRKMIKKLIKKEDLEIKKNLEPLCKYSNGFKKKKIIKIFEFLNKNL